MFVKTFVMMFVKTFVQVPATGFVNVFAKKAPRMPRRAASGTSRDRSEGLGSCDRSSYIHKIRTHGGGTEDM